MTDVHALIDRQRQRRLLDPSNPGLKINLYRGYEIEGVARAIDEDPFLQERTRIESIMVADSFLMTHLGRSSTILSAAPEQALFLDVMVSLVAEAAAQLARSFQGPDAPYLVADMPDGAADTVDDAARNAERMLSVGADVVKIEVKLPASLAIVEGLTARGIPVMAHLGYTPQGGERARVGRTIDEVLELFSMARRVREAGACALVIEKVCLLANERLSAPHPNSLPVYSIFAGRAPNGGQSLNVWDSVFRAPVAAKFFPPTGTWDVSGYPTIYTPDLIKDHMAELLRLTAEGAFPLDPASQLTAEGESELSRIDPWAAVAHSLAPSPLPPVALETGCQRQDHVRHGLGACNTRRRWCCRERSGSSSSLRSSRPLTSSSSAASSPRAFCSCSAF